MRRVKKPAVFEIELTYVPRISGVAKLSPHEKGFSFRAMMRETDWEWLKLEMLSRVPDLPRIVAQAINDFSIYVDIITSRLIAMCQKIKEAARQKGIRLKIIATRCNRPSCGTCLSTWNLHYPQLYVPDKSGKPRKVKTAKLRDFLRDLGFDEKWIERFFDLIRVRNTLVKTRNWLMYIAYRHGLIDFPEGEEL